MKRNKLLVLSLLACTLLASCDDENTSVIDGSNPVANASSGDVSYAALKNIQDFYADLKESTGGTLAVEKLIEKIAAIEYSDDQLARMSTASELEELGKSFDVRDYHTTETLKADIAKHYQDSIDTHTFDDEDGKFDPESYKESVENSYDDCEIKDGLTSEKYIADQELREALAYNYDEVIEKHVKPEILENYIYLDYVTSTSKYKNQFSSQYAVAFEVLKVPHDTTAINGSWNEALVKDVKKVTAGTGSVTFGTNYSFIAFNSADQMILFKSEANKLSYNVYNLTDDIAEKYIYSKVTDFDSLKQYEADSDEVKAIVAASTLDADASFEITPDEVANSAYYEKIEKILLARDLWEIDRQVVLAKNYDSNTSYYKALSSTDQSKAKEYASTYSSSNTKSIEDGVKAEKVEAEKEEYYTPLDYYTTGDLSTYLPSAIYSTRGTSAKDLVLHLSTFGDAKTYWLPLRENVTDPVYLDTSSSNYYICEVAKNGYYGYLKYTNLLDSSVSYKQVSDYQITAYQAGTCNEWIYEDSSYTEDTTHAISYTDTDEDSVAIWNNIIELVQTSAEEIITSTSKKEALVALFTKYGLEVNDQDVYDYAADQYSDYFDDDDD